MRKDKMADVMLEILDGFSFGMRSDIPAFKVPVFASGFEFWMKINEWVVVVDILTQIFAHHIVIHWSLFKA